MWSFCDKYPRSSVREECFVLLISPAYTDTCGQPNVIPTGYFDAAIKAAHICSHSATKAKLGILKRKRSRSILSQFAPIPPRSVHAQCFLCWRDTWPQAAGVIRCRWILPLWLSLLHWSGRSWVSPDSEIIMKQILSFIVFYLEIKFVDGDVSKGQTLLQ